MNTPHLHPRATEFLYLVDRGEMQVGFIEENGARFVTNTLTQGQGTIFPQGAIHFQVNLGCEPITFVAALNNEDPGASQVAQRCKCLD
jgi:oxalate decarboxylase/phosphoglucose isomerase-like protein (cupin superfamily)